MLTSPLNRWKVVKVGFSPMNFQLLKQSDIFTSNSSILRGSDRPSAQAFSIMPLPRQRKPPAPVEIASMEKPATPAKTIFGEGYSNLLSYNHIPKWYQENPFIFHGYRLVTNSARASFASWLYLHNETVNIYSHLLPGILFLIAESVMYQYIHARYPNAATSDYVVFAFFLLTVVICLGVSAMYHTFTNHSAHVSDIWLRLDFVGIIILVLGGFVSGIFMVFYCEPGLQMIYWAMVCTSRLSLKEERLRVFYTDCHAQLGSNIHSSSSKVSRSTLVYLSSLCVCRHWSIRICASSPRYQNLWPDPNVGALWYGILPRRRTTINTWGAFLCCQYPINHAMMLYDLRVVTNKEKKARIPESWRPGKCDLFGSSHQVFHFLVVFATGVHLIGLLSAFDYNYHYRTCRVS